MENERNPETRPAGCCEDPQVQHGRAQTAVPAGEQTAPALTVGDYIVMFIIFSLPVVNLILAFVWGFGGAVNPNKQNYAKAWLILMLIFFALGILMAVAGGLAARTLIPMVQEYF